MTSLQYSLKTVYVETILMLKQDSPFKSVSMFYYGLVNQSDVTALADIDLDIPEAKLRKVATIEANVKPMISPISVDECRHLVDLYKRYCNKRNSSKCNSASPFKSISQFYSGLGLSVDDINRIERGMRQLNMRDLRTIDQVQMMARLAEGERLELARQAALK